MIDAKDLRIGNLVTWNPRLLNPNITLPAMQVEVFSVLHDRIFYVFPNIENRVEPFEDDVAQMGERFKLLPELEPIAVTPEILLNEGFVQTTSGEHSYFEKGGLQLQQDGDSFKAAFTGTQGSVVFDLPAMYFHRLQNLYYALTGDELDTKISGQQS